MIRFGGRTEDGRKLVGLALGRQNIERLVGGEPILVDGKTVGAPEVVVLIASAETSEEIMRELVETAQSTGVSVEDLSSALEDAGIDRRPEKGWPKP